MKIGLGVVLGIDKTLVFVTPYDQVQKVWEERLWYKIRLGVLNAMVYFSISRFPQRVRQDLLVLMDADEIEPVLFLCTWLKELDLAIQEGVVKPLVPHIAYAIQSKLCVPFL